MRPQKVRLAIVTTHPIQYNAPLFQLLSLRDNIDILIFYTWGEAGGKIYDPDFGHSREWDVPLLDGYRYRFVENRAKAPGSHHFWGIVNPSLIAEITAWRPDALLVYGWSFHSHLSCLRHFKNKIPVFFRGDSTLLDEDGSLKTAVRRAFLRWVYRHVDVAFYAGLSNKAYFEKHGLRPSQLVRVPHAVDNRRFETIQPAQEAEVRDWRQSLGFAETDFVVLFAGKLEKKKDPGFLLALAERVVDSRIRFLLVGNGKLEKALKRVDTGGRVLFLDFQNQSKMPLVYRMGNVFILPSRGPGETWGLSANEAMHCGLPVILSGKVGGAVDLVKQGENGLVFQPGDVEGVASYLQKLSLDPEFYRKSCEKSRELVRNFSLERLPGLIEKAILERIN